jgi:hypothetical protein
MVTSSFGEEGVAMRALLLKYQQILQIRAQTGDREAPFPLFKAQCCKFPPMRFFLDTREIFS